MRAPLKKLALGAGATLGALALTVAVTEAVLRLADLGPAPPPRRGASEWAWGEFIHRPSSVPGLAYELVPGQSVEHNGVPIHVNDLGLRGPPRSASRPAGVRRIAVLGDSTTFGWGVPYPRTWCARLEARLNARDDGWTYEVLDFGVSGYATRDEVAVLEHKALPLDPDLVLVGYNLNDPEIEPRQPLQRFFAEPRWWWRLRTTLWLDQWWTRRTRRAHGGYAASLHREDGAGWRSVVSGFERMAALCAAQDVPLLVVIFPLGRVPADTATYKHAALHARVAAAASAAGLAALDLAPAYAAVPEGTRYLLPDLHPDPTGHDLAAEAVAGRLDRDPGLGLARP